MSLAKDPVESHIKNVPAEKIAAFIKKCGKDPPGDKLVSKPRWKMLHDYVDLALDDNFFLDGKHDKDLTFSSGFVFRCKHEPDYYICAIGVHYKLNVNVNGRANSQLYYYYTDLDNFISPNDVVDNIFTKITKKILRRDYEFAGGLHRKHGGTLGVMKTLLIESINGVHTV